MRMCCKHLPRLVTFLILTLALPMLLLACGDEATPIPATTQKYLTALQGEGWKIQAQDLKVLGQAQNLTFVQFPVGTRNVLRAFDSSFQLVNQADMVQVGLHDLSYSLNSNILKTEDRRQLENFATDFRQLSDKISPLVTINQFVTPLQTISKKLPTKIALPLTKLAPGLRALVGLTCNPVANLAALSCILNVVIEVLKLVGKRAEEVQTQLVPALTTLDDYLKITQSGPGSKVKEQTGSTSAHLTNLNGAFTSLEKEISPLVENVDKFVEWLSDGEILQSLRQEAADVLAKIATPVTAYQKALDKREDKIKGVQKILTDSQQPLDNSVQNYLQMLAQKP